jgi:uncharacterized protein YrrD
LKGYALHARDGDIGKLEEIYFDDKRWVVRYFVVRTGSWLLGRHVLIVPSVITGVDEEQECLQVDLAKEQIKHAPPVDTVLPVSRHYEKEYYRYYGWEPYWNDFWPSPYVMPSPEGEPEAPEHPHLRSSHEIRGYAIHARDGDIGYVDDFIVEDPGWLVRYLVVDTGKWLPGKRVLIAPTWIGQVDWSRQEVTVEQDRDAIEAAPPYDPAQVISHEYQVALYEHYGQKYEED